MNTCKTCQFRRDGECRFNPPTAIMELLKVGETAKSNARTVWPEVSDNDWCAKWAGRAEFRTAFPK